MNDFEKKLIDIDKDQLLIKFKNNLINLMDDYIKSSFIDYLIRLLKDSNCTKCEHWNYGRSWWICLKEHNIRSFSKDLINYYSIEDKEIIPFIDTYANNGCPDYKIRDISIYNKVKLIGVNE